MLADCNVDECEFCVLDSVVASNVVGIVVTATETVAVVDSVVADCVLAVCDLCVVGVKLSVCAVTDSADVDVVSDVT